MQFKQKARLARQKLDPALEEILPAVCLIKFPILNNVHWGYPGPVLTKIRVTETKIAKALCFSETLIFYK